MKYTAFCDGGSRGNPGPSASAFVIFEEGVIIDSQGQYLGVNTNNVAEWTSLILALESAKLNNYYPITIKLDSLLVVNQIQNLWKVKTPHLLPLYKKAKLLVTPQIKFEHVLREYNKDADALVNETLDNQL